MEKACGSCRFWDKIGFDEGYCMRNAPTINHLGVTVWPKISQYRWCGEWEDKDEED